MFDKDVKLIGILPSICEALNKYDLFNHFVNSSTFPTYGNWKSIVKNKVRDMESRSWFEFCSGHPNVHAAQACLVNVSPTPQPPPPPPWDNYSFLWSNLKTKIINFNQTDGITISDFITKKVSLLLGGLTQSPFDDALIVLIKTFIGSAVGKIHKLRTAKQRELEAPWLTE